MIRFFKALKMDLASLKERLYRDYKIYTKDWDKDQLRFSRIAGFWLANVSTVALLIILVTSGILTLFGVSIVVTVFLKEVIITLIVLQVCGWLWFVTSDSMIKD